MSYFIGVPTTFPLASWGWAVVTEGLTMITGKEVEIDRARKVARLEADNARLRKLAEQLTAGVRELRAAVAMRRSMARGRFRTPRASGKQRPTPHPRITKQVATRRAGLAR